MSKHYKYNKSNQDYAEYISTADLNKFDKMTTLKNFKPSYGKPILYLTEQELCKISKLIKQLIFTFAVIYMVITVHEIENKLDNLNKTVIIKPVSQTTNK